MFIIKRVSSIAIFAVAVSLIGCTARKPRSTGGEARVFAVADEVCWEIVEATVRDVFEREFHTPQTEKLFEVIWVPPEKFNDFATMRNLVILGTLDSEAEISTKVSAMLSSEVKVRVEEGTAYVFPQNEAWAREQLLLVLTSTSANALKEKMREHREYLYGLFHKKLIAETTANMYRKYERKDVSRDLMEKYGWSVRVQHDYDIRVEDREDNFLMLRRSLPGRERWLFVHWLDDADPAQIDRSWVEDVRDRLTQKFYQGDVINRGYTKTTTVDFVDRNALMLAGLWENEEHALGGPFRSYTFYDEESRRLYMIDISVSFPGGTKEAFLRQLDIMAHTFRTRFES